MSSRWYPIFQKGSPQLRVFLPNFWMKLVRPKDPLPPNVVEFHVPLAMTNYDIKNYLEKIYKIKVANVESTLENGKLKRAFGKIGGFITKEEDYRRAIVTLPKTESFTFPDLVPKEKVEEEEKDRKKMQKEQAKKFKEFENRGSQHPGVPTWFRF